MASDPCTLMHRLQTSSFAVDDLELYLDTHPDDQQALEAFCQVRAIRDLVVKQYQAEVGPLTAEESPCGTHWAWADRPWPWEGGC